jgi:hypothetical protein
LKPFELKKEYLKKHPEGTFFDREVMKAFGDRIHNYRVRSEGDYWVLWRKRAAKDRIGGKRLGLVWFHKQTFEYTDRDPYKPPFREGPPETGAIPG